MVRKKKKKVSEQEARTAKVFIRLEPSLVERTKAFRERMARETPGLNPTQSDAYRILLNKALETEGL